VSSLAYRDGEGARHEVLVLQTPAGDWQLLDVSPAQTRVIDTLDGQEDGRPQADALARDYLTTAKEAVEARGPNEAERISEQGGADADSHRTPSSAGREPRGRGVALSRPAG
jgi:hypothetical protein